MLYTLAQNADKTIWLPPQASSVAPAYDWLFYFITYICVAFFALIVGVMVYCCIKFRRREGGPKPSKITHNTPLELAWSILPSILLVVMFWYGFVGYLDARTPPVNAFEVKVHASQWAWSFEYPRGITSDELHIPVDRPVQFIMDSADVLHSFFIPAFRSKFDVVPGRYTKVWFTPTKVGEYALYCAEYCGTKHSDMRAKVFVHAQAGYLDVLAKLDPIVRLTEDEYKAYRADPQKFIDANPQFTGLKVPVQMGEKLYKSKGCMSCHSIDGSKNTGPTWKGIFGTEEPLEGGGKALVDENYIQESILNPGAKIRATFGNVMTVYQGRITQREIDLLIDFIKTLK